MDDGGDHFVETGWLEANLDRDDVRVLDCTVHLLRGADGTLRAESGRAEWERDHIPGSGFADLPGELSDRSSRLRFMMPPAEQFAGAI